jgi:hypothetical protein
MSYGVWIQMMDLDSIEIKKAAKKIGSREGQSYFDKMQKKNDFINIFLREELTEKRTPLNNILTLKKPLGNKI